MEDLFSLARGCLEADHPADKVALTLRAAELCAGGTCVLPLDQAPLRTLRPGRPVQPVLVHHTRLAPRKLGTPAGRAAFLHALAHIEFNAINLAWDAVYRFRGLPERFYLDWSRVAGEEALHFEMLCGRLQALGHAYGDFPAHDGLWEMAEKTAHDALVRMALVPRVLEARGLDVTPAMIARLRAADDPETADVLALILREEVGHVRLGSRWFHFLCEQRGLEPEETYFRLLDRYAGGEVICPLHRAARREAGFSEAEIARLERRCR